MLGLKLIHVGKRGHYSNFKPRSWISYYPLLCAGFEHDKDIITNLIDFW